MTPVRRREARLRRDVSKGAAAWALTLTIGMLLVGGCIPWGAL